MVRFSARVMFRVMSRVRFSVMVKFWIRDKLG